ncbi:alpha/beta fold hydrolase [Streptomyces actuosus]|uniref:alpha/beta fold hydrolase n=1 Tax=Streptomyces actuosus TaxID=1885 RepID=UPI0027DA8C07|nr:alpha/beta fold hydrolase [Streptomyces actuosus]
MSETAPTTLQYRCDGPEEAPVLILGPSLGTTWHMWDRQVPQLAQHWRVLRFDLPGHGGAPAHPAASVGELTARLLATLDSLGVQRFGYAGCAFGGAVGIELALRHPERLASLVLIAASARFGTAEEFQQRGMIVRTSGLDPIARTAPDRWFTGGFAAAQPAITDWAVQMVRTTDPGCYIAACDALAAFDVRAELGRVGAPTLVLAGSEDQASGPVEARSLVAGIPDARLAVVPGASHLVPVEQPAAVTELLVTHFTHAWRPAFDSTTGQTAVPATPALPAPAPYPQPVPAGAIAPFPEQPAPATTGPVVTPPTGPVGPFPEQPAPAMTGAPVTSPTGPVVPFPGQPDPAASVPAVTDPVMDAMNAPTGPVVPFPGQPDPAASVPAVTDPVMDAMNAPTGPVVPFPGQPDPAMTAPTGVITPLPEQPGPAAGRPDPYDTGLKIRREVLGDAHVDRVLAQADDFSGDFEEFLTRYAWGEIWDRPGLDRRTRSCVTLTALVVGGHLEELALHTRAALRNGLTPGEIREVLLQTAVLCGIPAANSAFRVAQQVVREETAPAE